MNTYEIIKSLRKQLRMSQDELAKKTGYSDRSSIAKIESGKVDLSETKISLFARALNVTPAVLMGLSDNNPVAVPVLSDQERQLLDNYRDASEEIRQAAFTMLEVSAEAQRKNGELTASSAG